MKLLTLGLMTVLAVNAFAAEKEKHETSLTLEAGAPDILVQGEYNGTLGEARDKTIGADVIALGHGKFRAVFLPGGLPGSGWDTKTKIEIEGATDGDTTEFSSPDGKATIKETKAKEYTMTGNLASLGNYSMKKVIRKSVTLG